jgi:hypothetical protein
MKQRRATATKMCVWLADPEEIVLGGESGIWMARPGVERELSPVEPVEGVRGRELYRGEVG